MLNLLPGGKVKIPLLTVLSLLLALGSWAREPLGGEADAALLRFVASEAGSFTFDTGVLRGTLRREGRSTGFVPVAAGGSAIAVGEGLFNHYRVFTRGRRYGDGARRWPSAAALLPDGSVEAVWPLAADRPFELRATYRLVNRNTINVVTTVQAKERLEAFEVFLASYFDRAFIDSRVWASQDPRKDSSAGFVSADRELGDWLAFPRDARAAAVIDDGRWALEPHPIEWTVMPYYALPLAIRRDPTTGLTVVALARRNDCFGLFTPYGEENHYSHYLSLFGHDIEAGQAATARSRLVVLSNPTEAEILAVADAFLAATP